MRNRLRSLRAERGWSQAALAARLGVSRQSVNAIETGRYDPSLPLTFRIARLFGRTIEELFLFDGADTEHSRDSSVIPVEGSAAQRVAPENAESPRPP